MKALLRKQKIARRMRNGGFSLNEIRKKLNVAKSSASNWCRNIEIGDIQKQRLLLKQSEARRRSGITKAKHSGNFRISENMKKLSKKVKHWDMKERDLLFFAAGLYAGEGDKSPKTHAFAISNTDYRLISVWLKFLELLKYDKNKLVGQIWLNSDTADYDVETFWKGILGDIRLKIQRRKYTGKRPAKKYGCVHLCLYNNNSKLKMVEMIDIIISNILRA